MFRLGSIAFISAAMLAATAATAETPAQAGDQAKKALDPSQVVCETQKVIGSRLAVKRICMTRAQWAERRLVDRQDVEKAQMGRSLRAD